MPWVLVGLALAAVVAVVLVFVGFAVFSAAPDPDEPPPPDATEPEDPAPPTAGDDAADDPQDPADDGSADDGADEESTDDEATDDGDPEAGDEPPRADPGASDLAPVAEADALPAEDAGKLGDVIDIRTSDLRYNEGEVFGSYFYRCLFDAHLENVTDVDQEFEMEFAVPHVPDRTWSGNPTTLAPGERSQIIVGWETTSLDELGITEAECTGPVELTTLTADPG